MGRSDANGQVSCPTLKPSPLPRKSLDNALPYARHRPEVFRSGRSNWSSWTLPSRASSGSLASPNRVGIPWRKAPKDLVRSDLDTYESGVVSPTETGRLLVQLMGDESGTRGGL